LHADVGQVGGDGRAHDPGADNRGFFDFSLHPWPPSILGVAHCKWPSCETIDLHRRRGPPMNELSFILSTPLVPHPQ
jgi:hypothetical protein